MRENGLVMLFRMKRKKGQYKVDFGSLYRIFNVFGRHYKRHWKILGLGYGSLVATVLVTLLKPWPLKLILDHIILSKPLPSEVSFIERWFANNTDWMLGALALSIVIVAVLEAMFSYFNKFYVSIVGERMVADIRERVFAHLQRLSLSFHESSRTGDIIYRMTSDVKDLKNVLINAPQDIAYRIMSIVSITVVMLALDWRLGLIAFSIIPILFIFTRRFGADVRKAVKKRKKKESDVASLISENVKSMATVQAYGQEESEKKRFEQQNLKSLDYMLRSVKLSQTFKRISELLVAAGTCAVLYYGAKYVLSGDILPGTLVVFVSYLKDLYGPIDKLTLAIVDLAKSQVSGERVIEIVENDMVIEDNPDAVPAPEFTGHVEFRNVTFAYEKGVPVLKDLSFTVEPGETIALVGHSGAGKSTLISLLLRFYDPNEGKILIDGDDIRSFQLKSLRSQKTIVLQDSILFRKTIYDNIIFGRPGACEKEVIEAAKMAEAHDFVMQLPEGYQTLIEEGGENLSGGQRQRICIARAMIRNSPILILDELSTGLDAEAEAKVGAAIHRLTRGKTTFIIAHKFSTIRNADKILLLEDGRLAQFGTHDQLLEQSREYRELYELQLGGGRQRSTSVQQAPIPV